MAKGIKTGGRTAGTPNKVTNELRLKFTLLLEDNIDKLQSDIDLLEPKERLKTLIEISKFVIPTLKATDLKINSVLDTLNVPNLPNIGNRK
jgi:hypothetical protein